MASHAIVDKLTPLLPMDNEEVALQVKQLHMMIKAATMTDPTLNQGVGRQDQDPNHGHSPRRDSASSSSTSGLGHEWTQDGDLRDVICTKDACG
jgi:hypothetical protein